MIDHDKVIKGLECCINPNTDCRDCPYLEKQTDLLTCAGVLLKDAMELLKEQAEEIRELREELIEMSTNGGTGNQQDVCRYLLNLMDVIEKRQRGEDQNV